MSEKEEGGIAKVVGAVATALLTLLLGAGEGIVKLLVRNGTKEVTEVGEVVAKPLLRHVDDVPVPQVAPILSHGDDVTFDIPSFQARPKQPRTIPLVPDPGDLAVEQAAKAAALKALYAEASDQSDEALKQIAEEAARKAARRESDAQKIHLSGAELDLIATAAATSALAEYQQEQHS